MHHSIRRWVTNTESAEPRERDADICALDLSDPTSSALGADTMSLHSFSWSEPGAGACLARPARCSSRVCLRGVDMAQMRATLATAVVG